MSFRVSTLSGSSFGSEVTFTEPNDAIGQLRQSHGRLPALLGESGGLLVIRGATELSRSPGYLVELASAFGTTVEDYDDGLTPSNLVHPEQSEIFVVSNAPDVNRLPPPRPSTISRADGFPTQYPARRGWHVDGSFRVPPPDVSLLYAVAPTPRGQGQTIYANGTAAYESLPPNLMSAVQDLVGLHIVRGFGRTGDEIADGSNRESAAVAPTSQQQPVARLHAVTGRTALYLCDGLQMDFVDGPFVGMEPGPTGRGASLLSELLKHLTRPEFTYVHEWSEGDLVVDDNRSLVHCATWFDTLRYVRTLWRTTVVADPVHG